MGRKAKFSFETKIDIVLRCLKEKTSAYHEATLLGINSARVREWISLYQSLGESGLITTSKNATYSDVIRQIKRFLLRQIKTGFTEHLTMV